VLNGALERNERPTIEYGVIDLHKKESRIRNLMEDGAIINR
jgi:hypothetical protein